MMKQILLYSLLLTFNICFAQAPEEGLVAFYPFSGNANDATSFQNDGVVDGPVLVEDRFGNLESAYSFDGIDDIISISNASQLFLNENFTLATWIFPEEVKTQFILVKSSAVNGELAAPYGMSLSGTNDYVFSVRPNGNIVQARFENYPINEWISMIAVKEGDTIRLYVNGVLVAQEAAAGPLVDNPSSLLIGTRLQQESNTFRGAIDDIRIYNRALSDEEIEGVLLNLEDENLESSIKVYPNPTTDVLQLSFPVNISPQSIEVFSVLGERVLASENTTVVDISNLAEGVYLAHIQTNKGIIIKKIVKK